MSTIRIWLAFLILAAPASAQEAVAPGHWPQWRGPNRDNLSAETGLLKQWPEGGPKLLWKAEGFGDGIPPVSVAGGRIYVLGYRDGKEFVSALDGDGKKVWSEPIGPATGEHPGMRFLSQRQVTVDDHLLYAFTAGGALLCLQTKNGKLVWQKSYNQFGGEVGSFWFCDQPLVDGNLLICRPGGSKGSLVALNKVHGALVWQSTQLKDRASHAAIVPVEFNKVRQYVVLSMESVAGVVAKTGQLAWRIERKGPTAVVSTPVTRDGIIFVSSGFGVGCNVFQITGAGGSFKAQDLYAGKQLENHHGGVVLLGEHVYGTDNGSLKCLELKTGKVVWQDRSVGKGAVLAADGHLLVRSERGPLAWVEATPEGYREKGRFEQPDRSKEPAWSHPVIAGGRLYLRDVGVLFCYDLRGPDYKEPPPPPKGKALPALPEVTLALPAEKPSEAIFVPTPQDIVEKMLEAARVTKEDIVYDLGSGDGRIVITASVKYGCASVGYEIVPKLVQESLAKAEEAGVRRRVTIKEEDLFAADITPADVVTLYLGAPNNERLLPKLRRLKPGARIVSHEHLLGETGPAPDRTIKMTSKEDGVEHVIHVWTAPLK